MREQLDSGGLTCDMASIFWDSSGMFWTQIYLPELKLLRGSLPVLSLTQE